VPDRVCLRLLDGHSEKMSGRQGSGVERWKSQRGVAGGSRSFFRMTCNNLQLKATFSVPLFVVSPASHTHKPRDVVQLDRVVFYLWTPSVCVCRRCTFSLRLSLGLENVFGADLFRFSSLSTSANPAPYPIPSAIPHSFQLTPWSCSIKPALANIVKMYSGLRV
jgi:hypothetical protein